MISRHPPTHNPAHQLDQKPRQSKTIHTPKHYSPSIPPKRRHRYAPSSPGQSTPLSAQLHPRQPQRQSIPTTASLTHSLNRPVRPHLHPVQKPFSKAALQLPQITHVKLEGLRLIDVTRRLPGLDIQVVDGVLVEGLGALARQEVRQPRGVGQPEDAPSATCQYEEKKGGEGEGGKLTTARSSARTQWRCSRAS